MLCSTIFFVALMGLGFLALVYLIFWVGPRINKIHDVQTEIATRVFRDPNWMFKQHYCNRDRGEIQYGFAPINIHTFLTEEEIAGLPE